MKQLSRFVIVLTLSSVAVFLGGCASSSSMGFNSPTSKESLLAQAGFQRKSASSQKQQQRLAQLPANKVSPVKYRGHTFYVYPMTASNQAFVGNKAQLEAYRKLRMEQNAQPNAAAEPRPVITEEIPGPGAHQIVIQEYDDWGPMLGTQ